jgi:hypothetical protein
MAPMQDLRTKRSESRDEAIHLLLSAVSRAEGGSGIALVDDRGRLLAGAGAARQMWAAVRASQWRGRPAVGFVSEPIPCVGEPMRLATFGPASSVSRAAKGVARIVTTLG